MTLLFKQKMFAWFGAFDVFDEEGQTVYTVKGRPALGHKLNVYDAQGNEVATLREELLHMMPHFKIIVGGQELGVLKGKLRLVHPEFNLDFNGWKVEGDFWQWNYTVKDESGNLVMTAQKKLWRMTDTYSIEVENPDDALLCLMVVLAIDAVKSNEEAAAAATST